MDSVAVSTYIFLAGAGFFAGFVDSIAGGGGLIALPALLSVGIPPHLALGTNKLQGSFGTFTAAVTYRCNGFVSLRELWGGVVYTALGAGIGTATIQHFPADFLNRIIPALLFIVFLYLLLFPDTGVKSKSLTVVPTRLFYTALGLTLGFYDGFFGPGTGAFWMMAFVLFLGLDLTKATARTKVMNFTSNAAALVFFVLGGQVFFSVGIVMGVAQILGAYVGSNLVVLKGVRLVRILFLIVIAGTILKLMISTYWFNAISG